jgi:hypothetical protein
MKTLGAFNLFDYNTWFGGDSTPEFSAPSSGGSSSTGSSDPFGWSSWFSDGGSSTDFNSGVSDSQLNAWNEYWASGGVMGADLSGGTSTSTSTGSSFDFLGGLNDFLAGITGVAQTGLGIWSGVQTIINQENPTDELVKLPGSNTPVVKRVTGGQTQYFPITQLYPSLAPQVQQAQNSWIGPALIAGVLGLGLILILKKN